MHPLVPHELAARAGLASVGVVYLIVLVFGRRLERAAALMLILQVVLDNVLHDYRPAAFQPASATIDGFILMALVAAMLASQRRWLIWASAYQLLAFCSDLLRALDPTTADAPFLTASIVFGYGVTAALAFGLWESRRALRRDPASSRRPDAGRRSRAREGRGVGGA